MNITRTHTITLSIRDVAAALRLAYPDDITVQAIPAEPKRVTVAGSGKAGDGITLTFGHDVAAAGESRALTLVSDGAA